MNGELPKGWVWTSLESITDIVLGQSPPSSTYNKGEIGLPFYQGKSEFGLIYPTPTKWCSSPKKIAEKGDVLISVRAPVGPTNICPEKSCIGRGLAAIRGLGNINNKFILYLLRNSEEKLRNKATGTTFEAITGNVLRNFEVPLPPLTEQQRIVNKIEELFTNLDKGVESLEQVKYKLKIYRQAILKYAMEGKLTEKWREENKIKIINYFQKLDIGETDGPNEKLVVPKEWKWAKLEKIISNISNGITEKQNKEKIGFPVTRIETISDGNINMNRVGYLNNLNDLQIDRYRLKIGDILFSNINSDSHLGKTAVFEIENQLLLHGMNLLLIRPHNKYISPQFLNYLFMFYRYSGVFISIAQHAVNQSSINQSKLKNLDMPLPPLEEQNIIVERIEQLFSLADYIEETVDSKLEESKTLRQSILKKAFEGKLVPQDPNDEPAEILLEKIKKQRLNKEKIVQEKLI